MHICVLGVPTNPHFPSRALKGMVTFSKGLRSRLEFFGGSGSWASIRKLWLAISLLTAAVQALPSVVLRVLVHSLAWNSAVAGFTILYRCRPGPSCCSWSCYRGGPVKRGSHFEQQP